jgi:dipeptidyl aminopeptidase/acylaminoacyl peptidase
MKRLSSFVLLLIPLAAASAELPVEHFFRKPEFAGLTLSPSGKYMAALAPANGRMNLHIIEVATLAPKRVTAFDDDINGYVWITDERLVFTMDDDGNESFGLYAVDRDGSDLKVLAAPARSQVEGGSFVVRQTSLLDRIPDSPDEVLVLNNERRAEYPDVYRMNIRTGRKTMAVLNPGNVSGWLVDQNGVVRVGSVQDGLRTAILYRDEAKAEFRTLAEFRYGEPDWAPVAFDHDGKRMYIAANEETGRYQVYEYDLEKKQRGGLIMGDDLVDVSQISISDHLKRPIAVVYTREKTRVRWLDPHIAELQTMVDEALPTTLNVLNFARDNYDVALVAAISDREPGAYYLLDAKAGKLKFLLRIMEWIDPKTMADMTPVSFPARDGMMLHGYLTLPQGSNGKGLPLIVNPHGGPQARDDWGFNPEVQFLANRGYAVLQVNFRGSSGYGLAFNKAGWRQWGRTMQNDLTDAVEWAVREGIARRDAVGIYGASYGGYAALAGLTFTPELYRFGINTVGVADLELLHATLPKHWELARAQFEQMIGSPRQDRDEMKAWSPVNHVEKIRAPLFMAYGERDPRVVLKHAQYMERELKRHKKTYEYISFHDEGHGFSKQENRYKYYKALEAFLQKHGHARERM